MIYDEDFCYGELDDCICPLRDNCKRYVLGEKAISEGYEPTWFTDPMWFSTPRFTDNKCELQIKMNDEKDNV